MDTMILKDVIHATSELPAHGQRPTTPAQFDTALVHYTSDAEETGAKGEHLSISQ